MSTILDPKLDSAKFKGQVVVVTGAANGIGRTATMMFVAQGATVVPVDIDANGLTELAKSLPSGEKPVSPQVCNLADEKEVHTTINHIVSTCGKIDVLVHLAGIYPGKPLLEVTALEYKQVFQVNMDSCFFLAQAILPHMQRARYGRIINTASQVAVRPEPLLSVYGASKGAVAAFTRAIAVEAGPGITANIVSPTLVQTPTAMRHGSSEQWFAAMKERQIIKRNALPRDVAHAILYLASPEAEFITGQLLDVGGGSLF